MRSRQHTLDRHAAVVGPGRRVGVDEELEGRRVLDELWGPGPAFGGGMDGGRRLVQAAERVEQWICRCGISDSISSSGEGAEAHLDQIVGAIAKRDLAWIEPEMGGDRPARRRGGRARV